MSDKKYTIHDLVMKRPASSFAHRWRDGTPIGSGMTGIMLYGATNVERLVINRSDLWHSGNDAPVPDVTEYLTEMRKLQSEGKYLEADWVMYNGLIEKGYKTDLAHMRALGEVMIHFKADGVFSKYSRVLHMDTAEAEVSYKLNKTAFNRKYFMSRPRDIAVIEINSENKTDFSLSSGFFNSGEGEIEKKIRKSDTENAEHRKINDCYVYSSNHEGKFFGIACRVVSDGDVAVSKNGILVTDAKKSLLLVKAFSNENERAEAENKAVKELNDCPAIYNELFEENFKIYQKLYNSADLKLYYGEDYLSNEALMEDAHQNEISTQLAEKIWRFARYMFISGTAEGRLPFPLYGLWPCGYEREFTHHVANENVQSIYWHTDVGGLSQLVKPLIDYYYSKMDGFRENARKLYGCRGIFIGTYTTPVNSTVAWYVPVILHFCGVAGWLSEHFYRYYLYTGDEKTLNEKILPFMLEAAEFYEDYHRLDSNGNIVFYPAVSPENSPIEYRDRTKPHALSATNNPTVELAIIKELLTNLLEIAKTHPELNEKTEAWKKLLKAIPEYMINSDGAIAEWMDENLHDAYDHRHLSHLYPVFPGTEIVDSGKTELMEAFGRAVDLRELGYMTGWSLAHMSAIYSRLNRAESAFNAINMLSKVCLLENFFTLHNDFRAMGITATDMGDETFAPVQFDALLGFANAIQEMLVFSTPKILQLLPACPKEFSIGEGRFRFTTGEIQMKWDTAKKECHGVITAIRPTNIKFILPFSNESQILELNPGEKFEF